MYDEFEYLETELLFEQLCLEDEEIIEEANINSSDIGAPSKQGNVRYIMITNSGKSSHQGRMKVSKPGVRISNKSSHNDYISIYRKNKNSIEFDGDLKKIDMKSKEYKFYEDLFIRNEKLIQLVKTSNGKYDNYVDDALVSDEKRRLLGCTINRDDNGNADIYDEHGKFSHRENIRGEEI